MIPSVGGGLCQLSNALYHVALQTGCEFVERHAHSRAVPGSAAAHGRDATVAWNYVDLRFRVPQRLVIRAQVRGENLVVLFSAAAGTRLATRTRNSPVVRIVNRPPMANSHEAANTCGTCTEPGCFRRDRQLAGASRKREPQGESPALRLAGMAELVRDPSLAAELKRRLQLFRLGQLGKGALSDVAELGANDLGGKTGPEETPV